MPPAAPRLLPEEQRVLGALVEKRLATPDHYPLTRNALIAACNQSTNRDPVVAYDEATVRAALDRLGDRRLTRAASGPGSRAPKHRHLVRETLELEEPAQALLALLLLRGPQTAAELRQRSGRLHAFADGEAVDATLADLAARRFAADVGRRPGERGTRWVHLLHGGDVPGAPTGGGEAAGPGADRGAAAAAHARAPTAPPGAPGTDEVRAGSGAPDGTASHPTAATGHAAPDRELAADVAALRDEVDGLRRELADLRAELGA